jgi:2-oxoglutarate dehydrogenase complex dehydrogenase (E1) component-like enzyme
MLIPQVEYNTIRWTRSRIWVRIEQLYPCPLAAVRKALVGWPRAAEVVWVQEEPRPAVDWALASPGNLRAPHRRMTG